MTTSSIIASGNSIFQTARRRIGTLRIPPPPRISPIPRWRSYEAILANEVIEICNRLIAFGREDVLDALHVDIEPEDAIAETFSAQMMSEEVALAVQNEQQHPNPLPPHMTSKLSIEDAALIEDALNEFVEEIITLESGDSNVMDEAFTGDVPIPRPWTPTMCSHQTRDEQNEPSNDDKTRRNERSQEGGNSSGNGQDSIIFPLTSESSGGDLTSETSRRLKIEDQVFEIIPFPSTTKMMEEPPPDTERITKDWPR